MYFIFVSTDGALREKHFDELLKIYYQSLTDTLDSLGGNTATQFPFEVLLSQVKQYGKFGVIMSAFMMFVVTTPSEDLPDMNFMAENMTNPDPEIMADLTKIFMFTNKTYDIRMRELLHDAIRYGFF